jgi:hypothetical protein
MKFDTSRYIQKALKHVHETYGFLFEKGYEVFSAEVVDLGWQVVLRKQDLFIKILNVREEEELYLRMGTPPPDEFTDIGSVLNAATGDMIPRWESSSPKVLEQYLDRIETYFAGEYVENKEGLRTAQEAYYVKNDSLLRAEQEKYSAAFPQGKVGSQPEPKATPVLHYPLIAIILVLILGGLITLGLVLADRLFAAF